MAIVDNLTISPTPLAGFPKQLLANWDRKVETETAYLTSVDTLEDGTEKRRGMKVRPRRFISSRLTAMDRREIAQLKNFQMRTAGQVVPYPIYSDTTRVSSINTNVFFGDFLDTRFFVGARLIYFSMDSQGVSDVASYVITHTSASFIVVSTTITALAGGGYEYVAPLIDADIELTPAAETLHTDINMSIDVNVNEKMDESGLVSLLTPARLTEFFDEMDSLDTVEGPRQWKDCDTDTNQAVLSAFHTDVDYAWLCIGGVRVACYNSGISATNPTNPTVLKSPCVPAPSSCAELIYMFASDNFNGGVCNTGTIGDSVWNDKGWSPGSWTGSGSEVVTGNMLEITANSGSNARFVQPNEPATSLDFERQIDWSVDSWASPGVSVNAVFFVKIGSSEVSVWREHTSTTEKIIGYVGPQVFSVNISNVLSGKFRIRRASGILYLDYDIGAGWVNGYNVANSGSCTAFRGPAVRTSPGSGAQTVKFDNYISLDENGNELEVNDPSGESCT